MEAASNHYYGEAEPFHRKDLSEPFLIGNSPRIREIRRDIRKVSDTDLAVLLLGETGTGKGVAALSLHNKSSRHRNQFMEVNCANVPHSLLESELFGYRKGAFTGAWQDKSGKFEEAANGTVFLDEISEIPPQMQAKLLHVLQDGEFSPVGSVENVRVNVRIVAATNANVGSLIKNGLFRKDLYYRLAVIHLHMPPLKERKEDILPLTSYFLEKYSKLYKKPPMEPSQKLLWNLEKHEWPGNVRELENTIKTYVALENEDIVLDNLRKCMKKGERTGRNQKTKHDVSDNIDPISLFYSYPGISLREITDMVGEKAEKTIIKQAVNATKGNKKRSAELLGVSYKSILSKMKTYGI
jgi:two-component system response regulator AtoC